jgi:hypothetical protein
MIAIAPLTTRAAWQALEAHYQKVREVHLWKLFADDPKRGERMTAKAVGIHFDYSKHRITADDKENSQLIVSRIMLDTFNALKMRYPEADAQRRQELLSIRTVRRVKCKKELYNQVLKTTWRGVSDTNSRFDFIRPYFQYTMQRIISVFYYI